MSRSTPARQSAPGSLQATVPVGELLSLWQHVNIIATFRQPGVRFLAPFPGKGGIVGRPFGAATIVGGRIVGVEGGARANPFRQVWIGQNLRPKAIRSALPCWSQPSALSWSKPLLAVLFVTPFG